MNWMESYKNIPNILPDVIEAFVEVYGEKHRKTITERLQNTLFVYAYTPQNMVEYMDWMKIVKRRQLGVVFLRYVFESICDAGSENIDLETQRINLDENTSTLIEKYIGSVDVFDKNLRLSEKRGILSWMSDRGAKDDDFSETEDIKLNRVEFINFLRGKEKKAITIDDLEEFYKTEEYREIKQKIDLCIEKFLHLTAEYDSFLKQEIEPYESKNTKKIKHLEQFVSDEIKRIFEIIFPQLPVEVQNYLNANYSNIDERSDAFFKAGHDSYNLGVPFVLESFSLLEENCENDTKKELIYFNRIRVLRSLGADVNDILDNFKFDTARKLYQQCLEKKGIKEFIIDSSVAEQITQLREEAYERYKREKVYFHLCIPKLNDEVTINLDSDDELQKSLIDYLSKQMDISPGAACYMIGNGELFDRLNSDFINYAMIFLGSITTSKNSFRFS